MKIPLLLKQCLSSLFPLETQGRSWADPMLEAYTQALLGTCAQGLSVHGMETRFFLQYSFEMS